MFSGKTIPKDPQGLVLRPRYVPEKVGVIKKKGVNRNCFHKIKT